MNKQFETVRITIDARTVEVEKGTTILKAAQQNNIYIPSLCAHKDLSPFGGCRICIVEVEKMRGLPTACTTPVEEGMVVRTDTARLRKERTEILSLILSEHPSSCLICDESSECKNFMGTIRKAGVTTGCRYCPNDAQCELQEVVSRIGLTELKYPIHYRNRQVEKEDPFYDRDYNLCILCGRCVRVCQEIRTANAISFKQRGPQTIIGPAFSRTHLESGCEFCGACVSICPTGSLAEKTRKWRGKEDREEISTCSLCGVGCQIRLHVKENEIIGALPAEDQLVNYGQLCVKGRFCIPELVNSHKRLKKPYKIQDNTRVDISWDEAIETAASKLSTCPPDEFGMLVSPNCTNEDLYIAQKFVRSAMGSSHIDTSARTFYGSGLNAYLNLMKMSVPLSELPHAPVILCIGLDTRFGRSVVGVTIRKAIKNGAKIISLNPRYHNLSVVADKWLQPAFGKEIDMLKKLVTLTKAAAAPKSKAKKKTAESGDDLPAVAEMLKQASSPIILIGTEFLNYDEYPQILKTIETLAQNINAGVLTLPAQNNLYGSIAMGAYPEFLPGGRPASKTKWNAAMLSPDRKLKVLYLVGEMPPGEEPLADYLIFQNVYPPDLAYEADLVLPAAAFTEVDGTSINGEGRVQRVRKAVNSPGEALPDWEILCRIAGKMGKSGFDFPAASDVHNEIAGMVGGFGEFDNPPRKAVPLTFEGRLISPPLRKSAAKKITPRLPFMLSTSVVEHTYRGFPLTDRVEGARKLFSEGIVDINPKDAEKLKIAPGDEVIVTAAHFERAWPVKISAEQPRGTVHVTLRKGETIGSNPHPVRIRRKNV